MPARYFCACNNHQFDEPDYSDPTQAAPCCPECGSTDIHDTSGAQRIATLEKYIQTLEEALTVYANDEDRYLMGNIEDLERMIKNAGMAIVFWTCPKECGGGVSWDHQEEFSYATCDVCGQTGEVRILKNTED